MNFKLLLILAVLTSTSCAAETEDGDGPLCTGEYQLLGPVPADAGRGIALDAQPSIVIDNDDGCAFEEGHEIAADPVLKQNGQLVDGTVTHKVVGRGAVFTFVPSAPLKANSPYTLSSGEHQFAFITGDSPTSPQPTPATIKAIKADSHAESDEGLTVTAAVGVDEPVIVHLLRTDENGKVLSLQANVDDRFAVPASSPIASGVGALGLEETDQVCYVAQTENLVGVLSAPSKPECVDTVHTGGCSIGRQRISPSSATPFAWLAAGCLAVIAGRRRRHV